MGIRRCVAVVQLSGASSVEALRARVEQLVRFYRPLGTPTPSVRIVRGCEAAIMVIDFDGGSHDFGSPVVFGGPLPVQIRTHGRLLHASRDQLRAAIRPLAAIAAGDDQIRIVTGSAPPTMLYEAIGAWGRAWSSHAAAAAYLATGRAELDETVLPEFLAAQFAGGSRTLVKGVTAVDAASSIDLRSDRCESRSYWPPQERWAPMDPGEAHDRAEEALLGSLTVRLEPFEHPVLGLTAGLDSRVAAVAMSELGIAFEALTFGDPTWPDVREAPVVAQRLAVPHRFSPIVATDDAEALRRADAEARWHEGAIQLGIGRIQWPEGITAWVTGGAGETGRAFYYRARAHTLPDPSPDEVTDTLAAALLSRIEGASKGAVENVTAAAAAWTAAARAIGTEGWRTLDVVYAEQRVQRWLRGMLSHELGVPIPAFGTPEIQRALVSLPLGERISDGFHRVFLANHAPALLPPEPVSERRLGRVAARLLDRIRRPSGSSSPVAVAPWKAHPEYRTWVADEVLRSQELTVAMGAGWCEMTRRGFLAEEPTAEVGALWAAGPIAFAAALKTLNGS